MPNLDLQARIQQIMTRAQSLRPNLLGKVQQGLQARGRGVLLQNVTNRIQSRMQGLMPSNTAAGQMLESINGSKARPTPPVPVQTEPSGYRPTS